MASPSFHATYSTISRAEKTDSSDTQSLSTSNVSGPALMRERVWMISSEKPLHSLELNIPGVVFIDCDDSISATDKLVLPSTEFEPKPEPSVILTADISKTNSRIVARIVVTSDSVELLESLEVVSLDAENENQGFKFRVKNENAKLKGSILTQVFVSDKHNLRNFSGHAATFVLDDAVLVHDDPEADVNVVATDSGGLYLASELGFTLRSLSASLQGIGVFQLRTPFINLQDELTLVAGVESCTLTVVAESISARKVVSFGEHAGEIHVQTDKLDADELISLVGLSGTIQFVGNGHVRKQHLMVGGSGIVDTSAITSDTADVLMGWSGRVLVHAVQELKVFCALFGTVAYVDVEPAVAIEESGWLWWRNNKSPSQIVLPAVAASSTFKAYEFRDPPLRQPVPVHHRVKKGTEPELVDANAFSWTTWGLATTGAVAVGAIVVIVTRRKAPRVPKRGLGV